MFSCVTVSHALTQVLLLFWQSATSHETKLESLFVDTYINWSLSYYLIDCRAMTVLLMDHCTFLMWVSHLELLCSGWRVAEMLTCMGGCRNPEKLS